MQGVDALAGVEAIISHMIVESFQMPCAHAPALSPLPLDPTISPRSAAEEVHNTLFHCLQFLIQESEQDLNSLS